jgi:site-specific DNA-methyltransferase (adenine-specific)
MTVFDLRRQDCVRGLKRLPAHSIDLVVTSPPYNLGVRYSKFSDRTNRSAYLRWCKTWAVEIARVLRRDGSFFLNVGASPSNPMLPHQLIFELRELFVLQNTIHWIKSISIGRQLSRLSPRTGVPSAPGRTRGGEPVADETFGHFKPINSRRFLNDCHEYIFHLTPEGRTPLDRLALGVPYQDKSNIARWSHTHGADLRCRGNTWFIPYETIKSRVKQRPHPATFPVELAQNCIKLHGILRVHTMLDPFLGIGNSAVAAQRCGVPKFVGFEIDKHYISEARRQIKAGESSLSSPSPEGIPAMRAATADGTFAAGDNFRLK